MIICAIVAVVAFVRPKGHHRIEIESRRCSSQFSIVSCVVHTERWNKQIQFYRVAWLFISPFFFLSLGLFLLPRLLLLHRRFCSFYFFCIFLFGATKLKWINGKSSNRKKKQKRRPKLPTPDRVEKSNTIYSQYFVSLSFELTFVVVVHSRDQYVAQWTRVNQQPTLSTHRNYSCASNGDLHRDAHSEIWRWNMQNTFLLHIVVMACEC